MKNRIITISREFGSGGRTIGRKVAEELGIKCYDADLLMKIAEESGFAPEYVKEDSEYASSGWMAPYFANRSTGMTNQDKIWQIQRKLILEIAEKESCVFVGRCADFILKNSADCLNVFIHASMEHRAERIVKEYGEREEAPEQRIKDKDKRRAAYHRFYTDMKWGQAKNYHITLDSGELGIDKCVAIIKSLY